MSNHCEDRDYYSVDEIMKYLEACPEPRPTRNEVVQFIDVCKGDYLGIKTTPKTDTQPELIEYCFVSK